MKYTDFYNFELNSGGLNNQVKHYSINNNLSVQNFNSKSIFESKAADRAQDGNIFLPLNESKGRLQHLNSNLENQNMEQISKSKNTAKWIQQENMEIEQRNTSPNSWKVGSKEGSDDCINYQHKILDVWHK